MKNPDSAKNQIDVLNRLFDHDLDAYDLIKKIKERCEECGISEEEANRLIEPYQIKPLPITKKPIPLSELACKCSHKKKDHVGTCRFCECERFKESL